MRGKRDPRTEASRDTLATAKLEPDGEYVADHRHECSHRGEHIRSLHHGVGHYFGEADLIRQASDGHRNRPVVASPGERDQDGDQAFKGVEDESEDSESRRFPRDIGGADIAAATSANIFSAHQSDEDEAEWNRAGKITEGAGDEEWIHDLCGSVTVAGVPFPKRKRF